MASGAFVLAMLFLDLGVFHRESRSRRCGNRTLDRLWCALALAFNGLVWYWGGSRAGTQFLTGYLVEWSLSMDNVFVFAVIFTFFQVPLKYQYRVLFWGILGAIVMRLAFVLAGAALIAPLRLDPGRSSAPFLIITGIKLAFNEDEVDPEKNLVLRLGRRSLPHPNRDARREVLRARRRAACASRRCSWCCLVVESTDVVFAVDSVPAIFGITHDPFIVFTSNIFAILGLRALYFLLAGLIDLFRYLHYGLAAVLVFVGLKMIAEYFTKLHFFKDYPWASLIVIIVLLGISIAASLIGQKADHRSHSAGFKPVLP